MCLNRADAMHIVFPGEIIDRWLNGEIHPLLCLPNTNVSVAAGKFIHANELRAASQDGRDQSWNLLQTTANQGCSRGSVSGWVMGTAKTELSVHSCACQLHVTLQPSSAPSSLARNTVHFPEKQFRLWSNCSEIPASNHCRHLCDPCPMWKVDNSPYPHCPIHLWSILHCCRRSLLCTGIFTAFIFPMSFSHAHVVLNAAWKNREVPLNMYIISSAKPRLAFSDGYY